MTLRRLSAYCLMFVVAGLFRPDWSGPRALAQTSAAPQTIAVSGSEGSQTLLKDVGLLIRQHRYRSAEQLLLGRLANQSANGSSEVFETALGEVYACSHQEDKAQHWLKRALAHYEQVSSPTIALLREQSRVAGLLADSYFRQAIVADAVGTLQRTYARYNREDLVDPPEEIGILSRLAAMGETSVGSGKNAPTLDAEMNRLVERLQTDYRRRLLSEDDYLRGMEHLAKYQSAVHRYDQAAKTLKQLIDASSAERGSSDLYSLRLELADVYRASGNIDDEIATLQAALPQPADNLSKPSGSSAARKSEPAGLRAMQSYTVAETERLLADALLRKDHRPQAAEQLGHAFWDYQLTLEQLASSATAEAEANQAIDISKTILLERLVDTSDRLREFGESPGASGDNLRWHKELLAIYEQSLLPEDTRIARLQVTLASLYLESSQFAQARTLLQHVRDECAGRPLVNVSVLVQTLNLLAESDLAIASQDSLPEAATALAQAAKAADGLPADDEMRWWVRLNTGRLRAAQGQYRQALAELEQTADAKPGVHTSPKLRSLALLYLGLLYKEQLELDRALQFCRQALELRQADLLPDHPELLQYYLALAELYIARHDDAKHDDRSLRESLGHAETIGRNLPDDHPSRAIVMHQEAMAHHLHDQNDPAERKAARAIWEQLAATCRRTGQQAMQARALHYLARLDYQDWADSAKAWNQRLRAENSGIDQREVKDLKEQIEKFNAREHQLEVARQQYRTMREDYDQSADQPFEQRQQAFQSIQAQHESLQQERKELDDLAAGLNQKRGDLLKAHDELVARGASVQPQDRIRWHDLLIQAEQQEQEALGLLGEARVYPSLHHAILCSEAQILEAQSQLGGDRRQLLDRALNALQEAVAVVEDPRAATFAGDFMRAEFFAQYQSAFDLQVRFLVQAGRLGEALVAAEQGRTRTLLDQLWPDDQPQRFSVKAVARVVESWRVSDRPLLYYYVGRQSSYLFVLGGARHEIQLFPLRMEPGSRTSTLSDDVAASYVAECVARLRDYFRTEHNAALIARNADVRQTLAAASAVLLPRQVVEYLRQEQARGTPSVTVIPHGAITQLPLEALIADGDEAHPYLADCAPPIVYAPSLLVLNDLDRRPKSSARTPSLLTVADPDYTARHEEGVSLASFHSELLSPLPESGIESRHIAQTFAENYGKQNVVSLSQQTATEEQFRAAVKQHFMFLHLAAHGIVGDDQGQPFGRIALTPPSTVSNSNDDGFLGLDEIRKLDLSGCELAVLSACKTNIGAALGRPAGSGVDAVLPAANNAALRLAQSDTCFSLASAFLAAGSRRVLATQWEVADPSTSAMVSVFFDKVTRELKAGRPVNYAELLAESRSDLRSKAEFNSPFYWAPFVLIGPSDDLPKP